MREFDLLVIGSGPAGQKAAIQAAKLRKRVAVIEKERVLGGSCINTGTLPSKTLKDAIYYLHGFKLRSFTNITYSLKKNMTLRDLMARKDLVIKHELEVITDQLERNDVEIIQGTASFVDQHILKVSAKSSDKDLLTAPFIVIATGSRPRRPEEIPFNDVTICDSDSILSTEVIPKSMIVMGGGVIGCEYASMFAAYGIKVTLFDTRNDLLRFVDQEIVQALIYHMRTNGVTMRLGEQLDKVTTDERGRAVTTLQSGKTVVTDVLLFAMGRIANIDMLNLAAAGITPDKMGQLKVNEHYQTEVPHIYAAGDVIGFPALAATSMEQGRLAACHMFRQLEEPAATLFPYGIYTIPEISMVGQTEQALTQASIPYEVGIARYREIARGQLIADPHGLLKLLFHRVTLELL